MGVFENLQGFKDGDALARHLTAATKKYYGTPARAFIAEILKDKQRALISIERHQKDFEAEVSKQSLGRQAQRVAGHFALLAAAGELATEFGITGWNNGDATIAALRGLQDWLAARATTGELEDWQILRRVRKFVEEYGTSRFQEAGGFGDEQLEEDPDGMRILKRAGYTKVASDGARIWYVVPEVLDSEICARYSQPRVRRLLKARSWLQTDQGRFTKNVRLPGSKEPRKMIVLTSKVLEDEIE